MPLAPLAWMGGGREGSVAPILFLWPVSVCACVLCVCVCVCLVSVCVSVPLVPFCLVFISSAVILAVLFPMSKPSDNPAWQPLTKTFALRVSASLRAWHSCRTARAIWSTLERPLHRLLHQTLPCGSCCCCLAVVFAACSPPCHLCLAVLLTSVCLSVRFVPLLPCLCACACCLDCA